MSAITLPSFDLDAVKIRLMFPDIGEGWTRDYADFIELEYIRLLGLAKIYLGKKNIVPSEDIDTFWHQHILDTTNYIKDCDIYFGFYLHHFPYFGFRGEDDKSKLKQSFIETHELYEQHFGKRKDFDGIKYTIRQPKYYIKDNKMSLTP